MPGLPGHQRLGLEADFIRTLVFVSRPGCAWPARTSLGLPYSSRLVCPEDTSPGPKHLPPPKVQRGPQTRCPTVWTLPGPRLGPGANFLAHRGTTGAFSSLFWKCPSLHTGTHLSGPSAHPLVLPVLPPRHTHAERVRISWCRPGFALGFPAGTGRPEEGSWLHLCNLGLTLALESQTQFFICEMGLSAFLEGPVEETPLPRDQTLSFGRGGTDANVPWEAPGSLLRGRDPSVGPHPSPVTLPGCQNPPPPSSLWSIRPHNPGCMRKGDPPGPQGRSGETSGVQREAGSFKGKPPSPKEGGVPAPGPQA